MLELAGSALSQIAYQRFKAMEGYDQRFQNGYDCQGLWLEVETERELNFDGLFVRNAGIEPVALTAEQLLDYKR